MEHQPPATSEHTAEATHREPNYVGVFWALLIFTVIEVGVTYIPNVNHILMAVILIALAVTKAALVALYYMHLKFEGWLVYLIALGPVGLAIMLVLSLFPDVGLRYLH